MCFGKNSVWMQELKKFNFDRMERIFIREFQVHFRGNAKLEQSRHQRNKRKKLQNRFKLSKLFPIFLLM